eukprot:677932-Alexandrium_andersonii.AAC.1
MRCGSEDCGCRVCDVGLVTAGPLDPRARSLIRNPREQWCRVHPSRARGPTLRPGRAVQASNA